LKRQRDIESRRMRAKWPLSSNIAGASAYSCSDDFAVGLLAATEKAGLRK
jgi:hypothetical protein